MNRFKKTITTALIGVAFFCHASIESAAAAKLPNIIFIFADDLGYADLACYGHPYAKTPVLDKLARDGTSFTQFYVSGVTCSPSRTGFMTSLLHARWKESPTNHGFGDHITITELLKKRGYRTGHFGKWHIGPTEGTYGIDVFEKGKGSARSARGRDSGLFDEAIKFIKNNAEGPFYVNIWGHATHAPVNTHPDLVKVFKDVVVDRSDFSKTMQHKFDECLKLGGELDSSMQQYLGDVYSIDTLVGELLETIDELGIRENTIVVFSSDHGPAPVILKGKKKSGPYSKNMLGYAGEFRGGKHNQYEGGVRVPFIIRWPGHIKENYIDDTNVSSALDWLPTLCSIAGIGNLPKGLDGEDVSDIWFGAKRSRSKPLFWKVNNANASPSMRDGKWKFHANLRKNVGVELYDLSVDPSESENVAKQHPEIVADLEAKMKAWLNELPPENRK